MLINIQDSLFQISFGSILLIIISGSLAVIFYTRIYTTIAYYYAVAEIGNDVKQGVVPSPLIPYSIPWVGHTLRFLEKNPNRWYHRQRLDPPHGVFSIVIGGRRTHIVTNPTATRHLFRHAYTGGLTRETFVQDLLVKCLLVSPQDTSVINTGEGRKQQEDVFHRYLVRREAVTELTSVFSHLLVRSYKEEFDDNDLLENFHLYHWLQRRIFSASLSSFFGMELMALYPQICDDIFAFDNDLCTFFFDFPRFLNRAAWTRRRRILDHLMKWDAHIQKTNKGVLAADSWDPVFGSRFNKARMRLYDGLNLSMQSRAGMNLSIMFALASNVIPSIGWILFHLLAGTDSQHLLKTVKEEVDMATQPDGTLDIAAVLSATPLLQSMWTEVLRHYCDNMIMREVVENTTIPLDDQGLRWMEAKRGSMIISPCWVPQHAVEDWGREGLGQRSDTFVANRFVGENLDRAQINALTGVPTTKMYPFGGGKSICAGRIFAKEEAMIAVAQTLVMFDFEVHGFVDANGKSKDGFPGLNPSLPGVVVHVPAGDLVVRIRKRTMTV